MVQLHFLPVRMLEISVSWSFEVREEMARIPSVNPLVPNPALPHWPLRVGNTCSKKWTLNFTSGFAPKSSPGLLSVWLRSSHVDSFRTSPNLNAKVTFPTTYLTLAPILIPDHFLFLVFHSSFGEPNIKYLRSLFYQWLHKTFPLWGVRIGKMDGGVWGWQCSELHLEQWFSTLTMHRDHQGSLVSPACSSPVPGGPIQCPQAGSVVWLLVENTADGDCISQPGLPQQDTTDGGA